MSEHRSANAIIVLILACALVTCDAPPPAMLSTPPGTYTPLPTATPTPVPTSTPLPTATPTPTPAPGDAERAALAEAAAAVGWSDPAFGEEPTLAGNRAYHSWSVAVIVPVGAEPIMEIRQYADDEAAARGLGYERGDPITFHRQTARRHQSTGVQYGVTAHLDTLVWQSGPRLFWVRDANNVGSQANAIPLAEALYVAAGRHGLMAPPAVTVVRDLSAQGTQSSPGLAAAGFAVTLRVQIHGTDLPDHVVVEERFAGAALVDPLGANYRQEADGTWVLGWSLSGDQIMPSELVYLVAVPCSATGTFQARGTVSFTTAGETVTYPIGGDATRPVAGPTCTPTDQAPG